jgi:hypothetical protein
MKKLILSLTILSFFSCSQDKKQWITVRENPKFATIFKFGYENRTSMYLDSAIAILNDSLLIYKNFWLWIHDDSMELIKVDNSIAYKIPKSRILLYNINSNEVKYIDSIYTSKSSIDSLISVFIHEIEWGGFYIYSDTLANKLDWSSLFSTIDKAVYAYLIERENYSILKYGIDYQKIDNTKKAEVIEKIRMQIAVYFRNPFPKPPPISDEELNHIFHELNDVMK